MHRKPKFSNLSNLVIAIVCLLLPLLLSSCQERQFRIGVSQCLHNDWNLQLTRDLEREADSHPEVNLDIETCTQGAQQQIADIRQMIERHDDAILISPEECDALGPVVDEATAAGIPVILIDSETSSHNATADICVDNREIGHCIGQYTAFSTTGHGSVICLMGHPGSTATNDRHQGFREYLLDFPDLQIVDSCYTDWSYDSALPKIDSLLTLHPDVNVIATQSDPIALAAYDACMKHGISPLPTIIGVDGLTGEGKGIDNVVEGKIAATCINPTGGLEAIHLALDILQGRPYQHNNQLQTLLVDRSNVNSFLQQEQRIDLLTERIEELNGTLGFYFQRSNLFQMFVIGLTLLVLLGVAFVVYIHRARQQKHELRQKVAEANQTKLDFFANVSHSFRTPLTLIAEPIHTMTEEGGLTERQKDLLQMMSDQSDKLLSLTDQVLKVLQEDLLKDGTRLDAVAQQQAQDTQTAASLRNKTYGITSEVKEAENRKTILIIDDNAEVRHYLGLVLERRGYLILTAPNGAEGLVVAQQNIPDLIICDVMMPVMDGLECCRHLKGDIATSSIPVLMLTAYALDDQRIQGYESGADAYITKPFNTDVLCARIQNLIASHPHIDSSKELEAEMDRIDMGKVDREFVEHFNDFVTKNMSDVDLDVQQLSDDFNMSRVQLYRKCKSITGKSPVEIIRDIRLRAACKLLQTTTETVSEVAYEVGFSSPSYFAKCYKDQYGESPTDVQKRARGVNS